MIPPRARHTLLAGAGLVTFVLLAGATYQGVATALERRQYPHPGRLVSIGSHQLHVHCTGDGSPTVVLEAPAAGMSAAWGWVQPQIARVTRVCSYDRSGLGWSEAGDRPYDPGAVSEQIQTLMLAAGESRPFVRAGQGLGAMFVTIAAAQFRDDTSAVVLIDPPPTAPADAPSPQRDVRLLTASPWLARAGVLRATRMLSDSATGLPPEAAGPLSAFLNRPDHLTRAARELARWDDVARLASRATLDPQLPAFRVEAAGSDRVAFLNDRAEGDAAARAIVEAVAAVRDVNRR